MTTSINEENSEEIRKQMDTLINQMINYRNQFVDATVEFACDWITKCIDNKVKSLPERTKEYGLEGLRKLKADLRELIEKTPAIVDEQVKADRLWPHLQQIPETKYVVFGRHGYKILDSSGLDTITQHDSQNKFTLDIAIRNSIANAGIILKDHGFLMEDSDWEVYDTKLRFRYGYEWSIKMNEALKQYTILFKQLIELNRKINTIERKKAEAEAKDLWDQA